MRTSEAASRRRVARSFAHYSGGAPIRLGRRVSVVARNRRRPLIEHNEATNEFRRNEAAFDGDDAGQLLLGIPSWRPEANGSPEAANCEPIARVMVAVRLSLRMARLTTKFLRARWHLLGALGMLSWHIIRTGR